MLTHAERTAGRGPGAGGRGPGAGGRGVVFDWRGAAPEVIQKHNSPAPPESAADRRTRRRPAPFSVSTLDAAVRGRAGPALCATLFREHDATPPRLRAPFTLPCPCHPIAEEAWRGAVVFAGFYLCWMKSSVVMTFAAVQSACGLFCFVFTFVIWQWAAGGWRTGNKGVAFAVPIFMAIRKCATALRKIRIQCSGNLTYMARAYPEKKLLKNFHRY